MDKWGYPANSVLFQVQKKTLFQLGSPDMRQSRGNFCVRCVPRIGYGHGGRLRRLAVRPLASKRASNQRARLNGVASAEPERAVRKWSEEEEGRKDVSHLGAEFRVILRQ